MLYNFNAWQKVQMREQPEAVHPKVIPAHNQICTQGQPTKKKLAEPIL